MIAFLSLLLAAQVAAAPRAQALQKSTMQQSADSVSAHLAKHPKQKVALKAATKSKAAAKTAPTAPLPPSTASVTAAPPPSAIQKRTPPPVPTKLRKRG